MKRQDDATLVITPGGGRRWSHPPRKLRDTRVQEPEREASLMHCSGRLTAALVQGMWNCVERVVLGYYGPVELDWDSAHMMAGPNISKFLNDAETIERRRRKRS